MPHTPIPVDQIDPAAQTLLREARAMMARSYSPYSRYAVGAAAVGESGMIHRGCNVENASYGLSLCAEVGAISAAMAAGEGDIHTIAVVAGRTTAAAPSDDDSIGMPCGRCRQLIQEIAARSGVDVRVLCATPRLDSVIDTTIAALLPAAFWPGNLS